MNKKIFFIDCDGTLFDAPRGMYAPSEKTKYAIKELIKNGHLVFIASGRCKCLLSEDITSLNPSGYLLTNGSYVEMNGEVIYKEPIKKESVDLLDEYCDTHGGFFYEASQKYIYLKDLDDPLFHAFVDAWGIGYDAFRNYKEDGFETYLMTSAFEDDKKCNEFYLNTLNKLECRRQYGFTSFDVTDIGLSKGSAIKKVLEILNIDKKDAYAFGDGLNDLEMIEAVGESYAMENGDEKLKALAKNVAPDVLDEGFYRSILQEGLIKPIEE